VRICEFIISLFATVTVVVSAFVFIIVVEIEVENVNSCAIYLYNVLQITAYLDNIYNQRNYCLSLLDLTLSQVW